MSHRFSRSARPRRSLLLGGVAGLAAVAVAAAVIGTFAGGGKRTSAPVAVRPAPVVPIRVSTSARPASPSPTAPATITPFALDVAPNRDLWLAGSTSCGTAPCTVLARSLDGGASWQRVRPPGVPFVAATIRFADRNLGWLLLRPSLGAATGTVYRTGDGGQHWTPTGPARAAALELRGNAAYVTVAGAREAQLYRLAAGGPATLVGPVAGTSLATGGDTVYAWDSTPDLDRPVPVSVVSGQGARTRPLPCDHVHAAQVQLAAQASGNGLVAVCAGEAGAGNQPKQVFRSADAGVAWARLAAPSDQGSAVNSVATSGSTIVLTGDRMPLVAGQGSGRWHAALAELGDSSGFADLFLTGPEHGYALGGDPVTVYATADSGITWWTLAIR